MIEITNKEDCCGCQSCKWICPVGAIKMQQDLEGFLYPKVNKKTCINCNKCETVCPQINPIVGMEEPEIIGCYQNDLEERLKSASGAIFPLIAKKIISEGGIVYGAAYDEEWNIRHRGVYELGDLDSLRGSKYVQSDVNNTYINIKKNLNKGKKVLFSGTPCQVQGLKKYLVKEYKNLLTIDLICHGVPSNKVWKSYLNELSMGKKVVSIIPRDKTNGLYNAPMVISFEDNTIISQNYDDNKYLIGFSQNLYLRESCYTCKFKSIKRCSDITIGDFWGKEVTHPGFGDDYGVSVILIHSFKGKKYMNSISNQIKSCTLAPEEIIPYNISLIKPTEKNGNREMFFKYLDQVGFKKALNKATRRTIVKKKIILTGYNILYPIYKKTLRKLIRKV